MTNRLRFAQALRAFAAEMVACDAPDDAFAEFLSEIDGFTKILAKTPRRLRKVGPKYNQQGEIVGFDYGNDMHYFSPVTGEGNPLSPPMQMHMEGDTAVGYVNFPASFEGPPGLVHGGSVAVVFDELFGLVLSMTDKPGMTGMLTIRYHKPCPIQTDLVLKGRVHSLSGRKLITKADINAGDQKVASAEGLFIMVDFEKYMGFADVRDGG